MTDLTRYAVVIEAELRGQEDLPVSARHYAMMSFKEGFTSEAGARNYAANIALAHIPSVKPSRVRALIYTLKPTSCDCFFADEITAEDAFVFNELANVGEEHIRQD